jgi:hypothetical protein
MHNTDPNVDKIAQSLNAVPVGPAARRSGARYGKSDGYQQRSK